jgi:Tfp pilus assembly protein PilN
MIEINLLPPEYRPRETTNVPLVLTILAGVVIVCGTFFFWMSVQSEVNELERANADLSRKKANLENEAKKVAKLKDEIDRQKSRQETIVDISQSKVMWSQKLEQFADIMTNYPSFWVQNLTLTKGAAGRGGTSSTLSMRMSGIGYDMRQVAGLRDTIQNDQNFFYHFDRLDSYTVQRVAVTGFRNATERMDFEVKLPVASGAPAAAGAGR